MRSSIRAFAAAALVAVAPIHAGAQRLAFKQEGAARWICGGVGAEERRELAALKPEASLELLFASAKRGTYLAGIELAVLDASGRTVVRGIAEGPTCLLDLPAGSYRITARLQGVERTANARPGKPAPRAVITFPEEPWDGIRASDEEKRQARE